jgi:hypothetical protein
LGVLIHILIHVLNRKNKNIPFSFSYFITDNDNWIRIILSALSIFALLLMSESLSEIFGVTLRDGSPARDVFAFMIGYFNHSLIRNVLKIFKK